MRCSGTLKIAEVTSRFKDVDQFVALVEKVGFKLTNKVSVLHLLSQHLTTVSWNAEESQQPFHAV